jgi:hypothetical protein
MRGNWRLDEGKRKFCYFLNNYTNVKSIIGHIHTDIAMSTIFAIP